MASEASKSNGAADSYIGSLISLTSKSEIRYEGVLFNINTDEASIGLRNVQSFGTEGRRKDGPQVPASDKVYEYIVFRGSDIRDLQVKSSPPVQTVPPVHNDPAVIQQSHYATPAQPSSMPAASATPAAGSLPDLSSQMPPPGLPRSTYPSNVPLYQPGGGLTSWNPSAPPATNASNLQVPMYWPGYYAPSGLLQTQQSLLRPMQGLSVPPSVQPPPAHPPSAQPQLVHLPAQYPTMPPSLPAGTSSLTASQTMDFPSLLQPIAGSTIPSTMPPVQPLAQVTDLSSNVMLSKAPAQVVPAVSQSSNPLLLTPLLSSASDKSHVASLDQTKPISSSSLPFNNLSESMSTLGGTSNSPMLVTPGQFLQPGSTMSQTSQTARKNIEVVQGSSVVSQPQASVAAATTTAQTTTIAFVPEAQPALLPLPSSSNSKINGASSYSQNVNLGGRDRGRRNEFATPVNFTEDFDFEAMNEKFKKDEVWGHLGKTKANVDDGVDLVVEPEIDQPKNNSKPVYKKDDFFDSLSCNALDRESRNGRPRFSEQMRLDTETFGDFARNRGYRGGRAYGRGGGGRSRGGGYYGRGYGYVGRGRGYNNMNHAI